MFDTLFFYSSPTVLSIGEVGGHSCSRINDNVSPLLWW